MNGNISRGARFILDNPLPPGAYNALDHQQGDDEIDGGGALAAVDGGDEDSEDEYDPIPCQDMYEIMSELGPPGPRHKCFGCRYAGQNRAAKIPDSRLAEMFQTMAEGIGVSWPSALAVQVAKQFETWRGVINETRGERDKLPKWSAASVLDHWFNHTCDPEIQQWLHMCWLQWQMCDMRMKCLKKRSRKTGAEVYDKEMCTVFRDTMRLWYQVSSKEPRKLSYFFEGAMLDRNTVTNGGIVRRGRPCYNFYRKGKRQRTVGGADFND
jgi:hypothetical protein